MEEHTSPGLESGLFLTHLGDGDLSAQPRVYKTGGAQ